MNLRRFVAALSAAGFAAAFLASSAAALAPNSYGYWSKFQPDGSPLALPPPPNAPSDGLYVAFDPSGPAAVSAVSYLVPTVADSVLMLFIATNSAGTPVIDACPTTEPFQGAQNAPLADAPKFDCAKGKVRGVVSADATSVTFALPATFIVDEMLDVALVPVGPLPFSTPFLGPQDESLQGRATEGGVEEDFVLDEETALATPDPFVPPSADVPFFADVPADDFGSFTGPTFTPAPFAAPVTPSTLPRAALPRAQGGASVVGATRPIAAVEDDRVARILAMLLLMAMGAAAFKLAEQPARGPRLLGGLGARSAGVATAVVAVSPFAADATAADRAPAAEPARVGGIGRFSRPRTAAPNRL